MSASPLPSTSAALLGDAVDIARHETVTTSEPSPAVAVSIDVDIGGTVWAEIVGEELHFRWMWIGCTQRAISAEELQEHVQGHVAVYAQYVAEGKATAQEPNLYASNYHLVPENRR